MSLSPAELLDLEDQPERHGLLRMFAAATTGVSVSAVVVPIALVLWFAALGRPGSHIGTPESIAAELRAAGKAGDRTPEQLLEAAQGLQSSRTAMSRFVYRPMEFLLVTSAVLFAACFAALYIKADDIHAGGGAGSLLMPTLAGTAAGTVALWGLLIVLVHMPAAEHGGHEAAAHGTHGPRTVSAALADNASLAEILAYVGGTVVAGLVAAATPRSSAGTARTPAGHGEAAAH